MPGETREVPRGGRAFTRGASLPRGSGSLRSIVLTSRRFRGEVATLAGVVVALILFVILAGRG